jgi:hypothetical protein
MASSTQKKTTMAKLNREAAVRERRQRKQAKKDARKQASVGQPGQASDALRMPTIGSSVAEFDPGTAELEDSSGNVATASGTDELGGPPGDKRITAETP